MMRGKTIKRETTHNGTLKTMVIFQRMMVSDDFYETNTKSEEIYKAWGEVSELSFQDLENLKGRFSKNALALESIKSKAIKSFVTVTIRDPMGQYLPSNSDTVKLLDERYADKDWDVIEVRPDFRSRHFLVVSLGSH